MKMLTVSGKCVCDRCEARTGNVYRMVGSCSNCKAGPVLMLFREGDKSWSLDCPVCGNYRSTRSGHKTTAVVRPSMARSVIPSGRRTTDDE